MATILVVDDDAHIREVARFALARAGHAVELATDGASALTRLASAAARAPDLIVLDVLMPELDGLALCRRLRALTTSGGGPTYGGSLARVPIIFLSSRTEETDRVLGLDLGADDYLTKPFSPRELVSRVAAVLRRTQGDSAPAVPSALPVLAIGEVAIDRDRHEVKVGDSPLDVTATELRLLATLASHRGRVLSRGQLIATVYGGDHHISERTIDTHVRNLRAKLAAAGAPVIETVHGVGYRCS
ncbi:MAG: response regulator transcription factor [Kofleriaceae bacterium]